ncbi:MAG: hypothetical protein M9893_11695 [Pyrinomonadaceae bacterium]|nr:hypothetical protein [Pyrinomonadaceae bacterium]
MISVGDALTLVKFGMMKVGKSLEKHVRAGLGNAGRIWLAGLENTLRALESRWQISVTESFRSVEYNFVAPAKRDSGEDVVLKIAPPWDPVEIFSEAEFLRHCGGIHCVRLLEEERPLRAILIEWLYPGRNLFQVFKGREAEMLLPAAEIIATVSTHATGSEIEASDVDDWFAGMDGFADTDFSGGVCSAGVEISAATKGHQILHPRRIWCIPRTFFPRGKDSRSLTLRALSGTSAMILRSFSIISPSGCLMTPIRITMHCLTMPCRSSLHASGFIPRVSANGRSARRL